MVPADAASRWMLDITGTGSVWVPKNTKVRAVVNEVLHCSDGISLSMLASSCGPGEASGHASSRSVSMSQSGDKENSGSGNVPAALGDGREGKAPGLRPLGQRPVFRVPM